MIVEHRLEPFGGEGQTLVFAHANGYPPGSYRHFLNLLGTRYRVRGYRHRPLWDDGPAPQRANWHRFAADLVETLEHGVEEPVWMVGHSLGAVVSMLAAVRRPDLFRGLVLIDPVFLSTRQALSTRFTPYPLLKRVPLISKTLGRPRHFDSAQAAFDFHRGKRAFTRFSDTALWDYVHAGTGASSDSEDTVELVWAPEWEAAVYASVPVVWRHLARLNLPTQGLRGVLSDTLSEQAFARWAVTQPGAELHTCPGGHLLPLEEPDSTAHYVLDYLARQPR